MMVVQDFVAFQLVCIKLKEKTFGIVKCTEKLV